MKMQMSPFPRSVASKMTVVTRMACSVFGGARCKTPSHFVFSIASLKPVPRRHHAMRFSVLPATVLASLVFGADADCNGPNAMTKPPSGAIVVDINGKYPGSFTSITQAVANLTDTAVSSHVFIMPGTYKEQVVIKDLNGSLVLQGYTCDAMVYTENQVTITQSKAQRDIPPDITRNRMDLTATLRLKTDNVRVYNLNVENTAGKISKDGQGLAVNADGDKCGFYACSFSGYQDTVNSDHGHQLFAKSHISGAVSLIIGYSQAWFDSCDIEVTGKGYITVNGRKTESDSSFYVINKARVYGANGIKTSLGRPWKPFSRVVVQNSDLTDVIIPEGWSEWNGDANTANVYYKEYHNSGPSAATNKRVPFSGQLSAPVSITEILGENYAKETYVDMRYLSSTPRRFC